MPGKAIKGPIPEITLTNVKGVTITDVSSGERVGRRFKVGHLPGKDDKNVIFHALFKQAQALLRDAKTREELHAVRDFISELKAVESKAQETYNAGDNNWYKFRSFWHRLFGGAFWGTHQGRLDQLEKKCITKEGKVLKGLEEIARIALFLAKDFPKEPENIQIGDQTYKVWREGKRGERKLYIEHADKRRMIVSLSPPIMIGGEGLSGDEPAILQAVIDRAVMSRDSKAAIKQTFNQIDLSIISYLSRDPISIKFKERDLSVWTVYNADTHRSCLHIQDKNKTNEHLEIHYGLFSCQKVSGNWYGNDENGLIEEIFAVGEKKRDFIREISGSMSVVNYSPMTAMMIKSQGREFLVWNEYDHPQEDLSSLHIKDCNESKGEMIITINHMGFYHGKGCKDVKGEIQGDSASIVRDFFSATKEREEEYAPHVGLIEDFEFFNGFSKVPMTVQVVNQEFLVWYEDDDQQRKTIYIQSQNNPDLKLSCLIHENTHSARCLAIEGNIGDDILSGILEVVKMRSQAFGELTREELESARAYVVGRPHTFLWQGDKYLIWKERSGTGEMEIHIQNEAYAGTKEKQIVAHLGQEMKAPKLRGVDGDIKYQTTRALLQAGISEASRRPTSGISYFSYTNSDGSNRTLKIEKRGPLMDPLLHFQLFGASVTGVESSGLKVKDGVATDLGGVKRDYVATLIEGLQNEESLFVELDGSLKLPRLKREGNHGVFICNTEEKDLFQSLGKVFYFCYGTSLSKKSLGQYDKTSLVTGRVFSDALFQAAFTLTAKEISKPFEMLSIEAKVRMAKALVSNLDTKIDDSGENMIRSLDLLIPENLTRSLNTMADLKERIDELNPKEKIELEAVKNKLTFATMLAGEEYLDDTCLWADEAVILQDVANFRDKLYKALFFNHELFKPLNGVALSSILDPIFQVAVGMNIQGADWEKLQAQKLTEVSVGIQGSLDRELMATMIKYTGSESVIQTKVGWLTQWIKEKATEEELKRFIKYLSGGTGLPKGSSIEIVEQYSSELSPNPSACTCGMKMGISNEMEYSGNFYSDPACWDDTEEKFIKNVKFVIQGEGFTQT